MLQCPNLALISKFRVRHQDISDKDTSVRFHRTPRRFPSSVHETSVSVRVWGRGDEGRFSSHHQTEFFVLVHTKRCLRRAVTSNPATHLLDHFVRAISMPCRVFYSKGAIVTQCICVRPSAYRSFFYATALFTTCGVLVCSAAHKNRANTTAFVMLIYDFSQYKTCQARRRNVAPFKHSLHYTGAVSERYKLPA